MESSIISAVNKGFFQQVRFLVELGLNVNERETGTGRTALCALALVDSTKWAVSLARLLIEHGASIRIRDKLGLNAMHYATIYERKDLMKVFLTAIDFNLNQGDKHGNTALHHAVASGNLDCVRIILNALLKYRMSVDKVNLVGATPLIYAWKEGQVECAMLIKDLANPNTELKDFEQNKSASEWEQDVMSGICGSKSTVTEKSQKSDGKDKSSCSKFSKSGSTDRETKSDLKSIERVVRSVEHKSVCEEKDNKSISEAKNSSPMQKSTSSMNSLLQHCDRTQSRSRFSQSESLSIFNHNSSMASISSTQNSPPSQISRQTQQKAFITRPKSSPSSLASNHSRSVSIRVTPPLKLKKKVIVPEFITKKQLGRSPIQDAVNNTRNKLAYLYQITEYEDVFKDAEADVLAYLRQHHHQDHDMSVESVGANDWRGFIRNLYNNYDFQFSPSFRSSAKCPDPPERPTSPLSDCFSESVSVSQADRLSIGTTRKQRKLSAASRNSQKRGLKKHGGSIMSLKSAH